MEALFPSKAAPPTRVRMLTSPRTRDGENKTDMERVQGGGVRERGGGCRAIVVSRVHVCTYTYEILTGK